MESQILEKSDYSNKSRIFPGKKESDQLLLVVSALWSFESFRVFDFSTVILSKRRIHI